MTSAVMQKRLGNLNGPRREGLRTDAAKVTESPTLALVTEDVNLKMNGFVLPVYECVSVSE